MAVAAGSRNDAVGKGLVNIDPARYGSLEHPGDAFSYDIYTQVGPGPPGRRRRRRRSAGSDPSGSLAIGESQSAFALTTYADGGAAPRPRPTTAS